ncbi:MAG: hypothetical protein AAGD22_18425 [Verrucomicrobiota bacterium]
MISAMALPLVAIDREEALRQELERVYERWRTSILTKNFDRWRETTASYRQVITRNAIVSRKQLFPSSIFNAPITPPPTDGLQLLKLDEKNQTAVAVYYGPINFNLGVEEIPNNLLVLKFLFEDDAWRYDNSRYINLAGAEHIREKVAKGDFEFLEEQDFAPLGMIPPASKLCPDPDFAAHIHLVSIGYRTRAKVNEFYEIDISQDGGTDIVTGGLQNGENTLKLEIERLELPPESEKDRHFAVTIYALRRETNKAPVPVFQFVSNDKDPPATLEKSIIVDPQAVSAHP